MEDYVGIDDLIGCVLTKIECEEEEITFISEKKKWRMSHLQDCCESVTIEDIIGDWDDLIGTPILAAYESTNSDMPPLDNHDDSYTWTFYHISTIKGTVSLRWYGTSNGYYSESVDIWVLN